VTTMKIELEEAEEGRRWLEKGKWDQKLRNKDAAAVCRDVVGGFEAVCEDWRRRLLSGQRSSVEALAG